MRFLRLLSTAVLISLCSILPDSAAFGAAKKYISVDCGEKVASTWCKGKGFAKASAWVMAGDIGAVSPTRLIGTRAVCDQPFCDGFKWLVCQK